MKIILVIEDDRSIRENLLLTLKCQGFYVLGAEDGKEGLRKARSIYPDLILCNVGLPCLDGYDLLQTIRQDPQLSATPFIFLTSKSSYPEIRQGMNLGADDYLAKPYDVQELVAIENIEIKSSSTASPWKKSPIGIASRIYPIRNSFGNAFRTCAIGPNRMG
jgi:diguanylate cyclase